jgi:acyl-CoA synthetase (AMP-forming)/AMP-acid ligase II
MTSDSTRMCRSGISFADTGQGRKGWEVEFNLADLYECVATRIPEREVVVWRDTRLTHRQLEARANRLAHGLAGMGLGVGDHVGVLMFSRPEYLETMVAAFKVRAVPINVNYRYVADELVYLFENAELRALVLESSFAPVVASILHRVPRLEHLIVVDDGADTSDALPGALDYEELLTANSPTAGFPPRSSDDAYIAYTGGTTGHPKGVVWRHEDIFFATMTPGVIVERPEDVAENAVAPIHPRLAPLAAMGVAVPDTFVSYALGPLMHVSGHWSAWGAMLSGGCAVLHPKRQMEAETVLETIDGERVTMLTIVGDSMGRPIVEAIEASPGRHATSSVLMLGSGGSILSSDVKARLFEGFPSARMLTEAIGSSESPAQAISLTIRGQGVAPALEFSADDRTTVFDDDLRSVAPGSGAVGRLATRGRVPVGYYHDAEKSAHTFIDVDGSRWALPGDMATIEADGTIRLLGRGTMCINTGGEKVYPEEVEAVLKTHPKIADAVVVGVPDPRFGEQVTAVFQPISGEPAPSLAEIQSHCRPHLAGHKVPRQVFAVDSVPRSPSGKPDYPWAKEVALSGSVGVSDGVE